MGIVVLKACNSASCCIPLQPPLTFVNQSEMFVAREDYHYQYCCEWNCWMSGGEYMDVHWRRACNSSKERANPRDFFLCPQYDSVSLYKVPLVIELVSVKML